MADARKKVIVRKVGETTLAGYLPSSGFTCDGALQLLDVEGRVLSVLLSEVKTVCYVRDFNLGDSSDPERLARRSFLARPRSEGLWLRTTFVGGDSLEGLATLDLTLFDTLRDDLGLFVTPPDVRSNTQRVFIPHAAISALEILGVITTPSKVRPVEAARKIDLGLQEELFPSKR